MLLPHQEAVATVYMCLLCHNLAREDSKGSRQQRLGPDQQLRCGTRNAALFGLNQGKLTAFPSFSLLKYQYSCAADTDTAKEQSGHTPVLMICSATAHLLCCGTGQCDQRQGSDLTSVCGEANVSTAQ